MGAGCNDDVVNEVLTFAAFSAVERVRNMGQYKVSKEDRVISLYSENVEPISMRFLNHNIINLKCVFSSVR